MMPVFSSQLLLVAIVCLNIQPVTAQSSSSSGSGPFDLSFPGDSDDGYAITDDVPDMMSFSVCFWLKLVYPAGSIKTMALLSYSNSKYDSAYILDTQGSSINIYMDDMAVLYPSIDLKDEKWHHACVMWDQTNPGTSVYFEGVHATSFSRPFRQEKGLQGGGTLIIGAKKKMPQGEFINRLNGSLSSLNIWNKFLTADEVQKVYRSCDQSRGTVLYWCAHVIGPMLRNGVTMVTPSTACTALYGDAIFTSQANSRLMGHKITQYIVTHEFVCASHCLRICRCQSFNIRKRQDGQYLCQLNSATDKEFPNDLILTNHESATYHAMLY